MLQLQRSRVPIVLLASICCPSGLRTGCDSHYRIAMTPPIRHVTDLPMGRIRSIDTGVTHV